MTVEAMMTGRMRQCDMVWPITAVRLYRGSDS